MVSTAAAIALHSKRNTKKEAGPEHLFPDSKPVYKYFPKKSNAQDNTYGKLIL
jgi:hypothetical protein